MSAASPYLRRIQQQFRDLGINDDVQIAQHVAFLLLVHDRWDELKNTRSYDLFRLLPEIHQELQQRYPGLQHIPNPPSIRGTTDGQTLQYLIDQLMQAVDQSPTESLGQFFQREMRFELLKSSGGSQYPTPYHIANFMASLGVAGMFADVFDPAAGSGGLIAAAYEHGSIDATGCDYDSAWSALGATNMLLHDDSPGGTFHLGSALGLFDTYADHFTTVLTNPPFSGSRPPDEVEQMLRTTEYGTGIVNVLAVLALNVIKPNGRVVMLVPSGILFGRGNNMRLRTLFARQHLEAIITLDKECFQPYSNVQAHAVVMQKPDEAGPNSLFATWMCNIARDGYPTGAGRDLTEER